MSNLTDTQKRMVESYSNRDIPTTFREEFKVEYRKEPNWLRNIILFCIEKLSNLLKR
jgi:hypothetical protein